MVDFNNETTIGTPAVDVVRILILQRRSDLIEAIERHNKISFQGSDTDGAVIRARLISLFIEVQAGLKRRLVAQDYEALKKRVYDPNADYDTIMECLEYINSYLDELRLTRIDTKPLVDKTKWEEHNQAYGY